MRQNGEQRSASSWQQWTVTLSMLSVTELRACWQWPSVAVSDVTGDTALAQKLTQGSVKWFPRVAARARAAWWADWWADWWLMGGVIGGLMGGVIGGLIGGLIDGLIGGLIGGL